MDARVDEVVFHALEKEREKRFRSAGEVKTSVEAITAHPAGQTPARPAPQPSGLHTPCYFNTPARMRDCFPSAAARIFTCKGELALAAETLTFTSTWRTAITIPLKDIEDLSVGQFQMWTTPWVMKYARINFLSVTFRREGQSQTVHLTPWSRGLTPRRPNQRLRGPLVRAGAPGGPPMHGHSAALHRIPRHYPSAPSRRGIGRRCLWCSDAC